jgi:hypothetical protein
MQVRDGLHKAQPKPGSRRSSALLQSVQTLENPLMLVGGYSWAVVLNNRYDLFVLLVDAEANQSARRTVPDRIFDEVRVHLRQQFGITMHKVAPFGVYLAPEHIPGILGYAGIYCCEVVKNRSQIDAGKARLAGTGFNLRNP